MRSAFACCIGLGSLLVPLAVAAEPSFLGLGTLANGAFECRAWGMSPDGMTVVGGCDVLPGGAPGAAEAFRWSETGGMVGLGHLPGNVYSRALDVAADGSTAVGYSGPGSCGRCEEEAVVWTGGQMTPLGSTEGGTVAHAVSADGSVVAGRYGGPGFRWTSASGLELLTPAGEAMAISGDGLTIAGWMYGDDPALLAYRWTREEGVVALGAEISVASGMSSNASAIVGCLPLSPAGCEPFRWTATGGLSRLGTPPNPGHANDACASGEITVGGTEQPSKEAFLWDVQSGGHPLKQVLELQGLDLSGWTLTDARAISDDCRSIVGWGTNPSGEVEGWLATFDLPLPHVAADLPAASVGSRVVVAVFLIAAALAAARRQLPSTAAPQSATRRESQ